MTLGFLIPEVNLLCVEPQVNYIYLPRPIFFEKWYTFVPRVCIFSTWTLPRTSKLWSVVRTLVVYKIPYRRARAWPSVARAKVSCIQELWLIPLNTENFATHPLIRKNLPQLLIFLTPTVFFAGLSLFQGERTLPKGRFWHFQSGGLARGVGNFSPLTLFTRRHCAAPRSRQAIADCRTLLKFIFWFV